MTATTLFSNWGLRVFSILFWEKKLKTGGPGLSYCYNTVLLPYIIIAITLIHLHQTLEVINSVQSQSLRSQWPDILGSMLLVVHSKRTFWEMEKKHTHNKPLFRRNEHITQILYGSDLGNPSAEKGCCTNFGISRVCGRDDKKNTKPPLFYFWKQRCWSPFTACANQVLQIICTKGDLVQWWEMVLLAGKNIRRKDSVYQGLSRPRTLLSSCGLLRSSNANHHKPLSTNINGPRQALWTP